ncbi:hypothetical protein Btru_056518 [Bulinus truncatus]|nr:hypothetical protein Btru_056518 [Bulinus truncatus]
MHVKPYLSHCFIEKKDEENDWSLIVNNVEALKRAVVKMVGLGGGEVSLFAGGVFSDGLGTLTDGVLSQLTR